MMHKRIKIIKLSIISEKDYLEISNLNKKKIWRSTKKLVEYGEEIKKKDIYR